MALIQTLRVGTSRTTRQFRPTLHLLLYREASSMAPTVSDSSAWLELNLTPLRSKGLTSHLAQRSIFAKARRRLCQRRVQGCRLRQDLYSKWSATTRNMSTLIRISGLTEEINQTPPRVSKLAPAPSSMLKIQSPPLRLQLPRSPLTEAKRHERGLSSCESGTILWSKTRKTSPS